ncbi:MAG: RNA methyltransferase [Pyrinomonadaceae bacterium]
MIKLNEMNHFDKITSRENTRLANVRRIRDGKAEDEIFIEGRRLVEEALRSKLAISGCFVSDEFDGSDLIDEITERGIEVSLVASRLFSSICDTKTPQGIIVTATCPSAGKVRIETRIRSRRLPLVLYLKEVNNPSNLGAVMRTAEAADVAGVVISARSADAFSPKSIRASMGAVFRIPVWEGAEFSELTAWAEQNGLIVTASDVSAEKSYTEIDWKFPRLLVIGSEAHGLDAGELASVAEKILIPMANGVESLNLAVATAIMVFEAKRQNG